MRNPIHLCFAAALWCIAFSAMGQNKSVTVFTDDFLGSEAVLGIGRYSYMDLVRLGVPMVRSVRVPDGMQVTLYEKDNFQGNTIVLTDDANARWLAMKGFGQIINNISVEVAALSEKLTTAPYVTIYKDNFSGPSKKLRAGAYDFFELGSVDNDQVSSVKVPQGMKVTLYSDKEMGGNKLELLADASTAFLSEKKFNNVTSSVRVEEVPVPVTVVTAPAIESPETGTEAEVTTGEETDSVEEVKGPFVTIYFANSSKRFPVGRYDALEIGADRSLNSIRMPTPGLRVILFSEAGFKGRSLTIDEDMISHSYFEEKNFLSTSSMIVEKIPSVVLYQDNYAGDSAIFYLPGYYYEGSLGINNDDLSSIRVDEGFWILLCDDNGFRGRSILLTKNSSQDFFSGREFNNKTSSMIIGTSGDPLPLATLYRDNRTGPSVKLTPGEYSILELNNSVSSIELPRGLRITLFDEPGFEGKAISLNSSVDAGYLASVGFDDVASSAIVEIMTPREYTVTIYTEQYKGLGQDLLPGKYRAKDLSIGDNRISSIHVPAGMRVTLYGDDNFKGMIQRVDRDTDFSGSRYQDNIYSSLVVEDVFEPVIRNVPAETTPPQPVKEESNPIPPVKQMPAESSCDMTEKEFYLALKAIEAKPFSEEKMSIARLSTKGKCLTNEQIRSIASQFAFEEQTLEFVEYAYDLSKEKSLYYTLDDVFKYMSSKDAFATFLKSK